MCIYILVYKCAYIWIVDFVFYHMFVYTHVCCMSVTV